MQVGEDPSFTRRPTLFTNEFSLENRAAVVTGAQRGLGLEMASRTHSLKPVLLYNCLDVPQEGDVDPSFSATKNYISRLGLPEHARLEYASVDVTAQKAIWETAEKIAEKEGRLDVCVAAAGILA